MKWLKLVVLLAGVMSLVGCGKKCISFETCELDCPEGAIVEKNDREVEVCCIKNLKKQGKCVQWTTYGNRIETEWENGIEHALTIPPGDRVEATRMSLEKIHNTLEMYLYEHDEYPSQLSELTKKTGRGKLALIKKWELQDPWKKDWSYSVEGGSFRLCSSGPDSRAGTDDDICDGDEEK